MKIQFFDTHKFEVDRFTHLATQQGHTIKFVDFKLSPDTAQLSEPCEVVCCFVNDRVNRDCIEKLSHSGVKLIALRCAGYNNVDLAAADEFKIQVVRVPEYSPFAVAEHTLTLLMSLNRHICKASNRTREGNFSLDGLVGFDLHGKTVGVIGTGRIGRAFCNILLGIGCQVLAFDQLPNLELTQRGVQYTTLDEIYRQADVLSLHVPLTKNTHHLIDHTAIQKMKDGVILINTSRGKLIDSKALIQALKTKKIAAAGLDVYEEEEAYFFEDHSDGPLNDDILARLLSFPNVLLTSHQAFLTNEALDKIAKTTMQNISDFAAGSTLVNKVQISN